MFVINIGEITAFSCCENNIEIYGEDGRCLYTHQNPQGKEITFNLIAGNWITTNRLTRLQYPLRYICPDLHSPINPSKHKEVRYKVEDNPHLCSIHFDTDPNYVDVTIDPSIYKSDIPFLQFILFHEEGHFYYSGAKKWMGIIYFWIEHLCDVFAAYFMLQFGYNPSQCYYACELALSEGKGVRLRKKWMGQWLKKVVCINPNKHEPI